MTSIRNSILAVFLVSLAMRNVVIGPISVTQLTLVLSYAAAIFLVLVGKIRISYNSLGVAIIWLAVPSVFWMADIFSALVHDQGDVGAAVIKARIGSFLAFSLPFLLYSPSTSLARCNRAMVITAVISAITIISTAFGYFDFSKIGGRINTTEFAFIAGMAVPRTSGILSDFGDLALLYSFVVPWAVLVSRSHIEKAKVLPCVLILLVATLISLSRNLWLVVALTLLSSLVFYVHLNAQRQKFKSLSIMLIGIGGLIVIAGLSGQLFDVLLSMREASSGARMLQLQGFAEIFPKNFLFGSGVDSCVFYGNPIHNAILLAFCRTGLIGGIPFTAIYVMNFALLLHGALRARRIIDTSEREALASLFVSFLGFFVATMLFPGGAGNASQIFWGLLGLFTRISLSQVLARPSAAMSRITTPSKDRFSPLKLNGSRT